jgi:hypothetical protein
LYPFFPVLKLHFGEVQDYSCKSGFAASPGHLCRVLFEPFSEADNGILGKSEMLVERDGVNVVPTNLKIYFRTAKLAKPPFRLDHHR